MSRQQQPDRASETARQKEWRERMRQAHPEGCHICGAPLFVLAERLCQRCYAARIRRAKDQQPESERFDECPGWPDPCGNRKIATNPYCATCRRRAGIPTMDFVLADSSQHRNMSSERQDAWAIAAIILVAEVLDTDRLTLPRYREASEALEAESDSIERSLPTRRQLQRWGWARLAKLAGIETGAPVDFTQTVMRPAGTWSATKCTKALRIVVTEQGRYLSGDEYDALKHPGMPSSPTVTRLVGDGSWMKCMSKVGYGIPVNHCQANRFTTRESILQAGKLWLQRHGERPPAYEWQQPSQDYPSYHQVKRLWRDEGGWLGFWRELNAERFETCCKGHNDWMPSKCRGGRTCRTCARKRKQARHAQTT